MTPARRRLLFAGVGTAAVAAGFLLAGKRRSGGPQPDAAAAVLGAALTDLDGRARTLKDYQGKVLIINYWATWCAPCREEIPLFVRLQQEYAPKNVQFVGVSIDQADKVREFAREFGINYPLLIGGIDAVEQSRKAGNQAGVLPFTLLIRSDGGIAASLIGSITEERLRQQLAPLL